MPSPPDPSHAELERLGDDEVMAHLQAGSHDALAVLFDRYHRLVLSIALRIVRDAGEAEDVMQIVFLDVFKAAAQFDPARGSTKVWLLQYAYHRALSRKRYLNVRSFYDQANDDRPPGPAGWDRATAGAELEQRDLLQKGLASLAERQRQVIEWASFEGLSMREIADRTGETLVNVRHHYYRGLRKLRAFVQRHSGVENPLSDV
jgi:RNA polymerase sigma-70 factor (ECF subfamily)